MVLKSSSRVALGLFVGFLALFMVGCTLEPITSYQGYLTDSSGNPVADGTYSAQFRLYSQPSGGTALYTQNVNVTVENGLFDTSFGGADVPTEIYSQPLYLEVRIEGEVLTPRRALHGAPYAFSLASGAVVRANESITRTQTIGGDTYSNAGSGFYVVNQDSSAFGGSGIVGVTSSTNTQAAGVRGQSVRASAGASSTYGGRFDSAGYRGLRTGTENASFYSAAFFGGIGIYVEGNCTGCRPTEFGQNNGSADIQPGEFVAVSGVEVHGKSGQPIMQLQRASQSEDVVVGVALGVASIPDPDATTAVPDLELRAARPGETLLVVTQGLVQVRLDGSEAAIGDYLTIGGDGATLMASEDSQKVGIARVMSAPDESGLVWVMLGGQ